MTDTNSFDQQVVLITAAASGLGRGIAIDLARHGATVHVWDRDAQALAELSSDAKSENLAISTRAVDLSNEREVEQAFSATIEQSSKIDVLINNAGGSLHTPFNFLKQSKEDWERVFNLNLMLTVKLTQLVIPLMIDRQYGRIINIGSKAGRYGSLFAGANSATADEFMVTAKQAAGLPSAAPTYGDTGNGYGNMYINSTTSDIFIYA